MDLGVCHTMGFACHPQERGFGAPVNPAQAQPGQPGAGPAWRKLTVIAESPGSLIKNATKIRLFLRATKGWSSGHQFPEIQSSDSDHEEKTQIFVTISIQRSCSVRVSVMFSFLGAKPLVLNGQACFLPLDIALFSKQNLPLQLKASWLRATPNPGFRRPCTIRSKEQKTPGWPRPTLAGLDWQHLDPREIPIWDLATANIAMDYIPSGNWRPDFVHLDCHVWWYTGG